VNEILGVGFAQLPEKEKLRRAAQELEAVVLAQLFSAMRKTVPDGGLFEKSMSEEIFHSMLDAELARTTSAKSPFGLAKTLVERLENGVKDSEAEAERTGRETLPLEGRKQSWRI
jgi:flagellar protein FlgJ